MRPYIGSGQGSGGPNFLHDGRLNTPAPECPLILLGHHPDLLRPLGSLDPPAPFRNLPAGHQVTELPAKSFHHAAVLQEYSRGNRRSRHRAPEEWDIQLPKKAGLPERDHGKMMANIERLAGVQGFRMPQGTALGRGFFSVKVLG